MMCHIDWNTIVKTTTIFFKISRKKNKTIITEFTKLFMIKNGRD